MAKTRNTEEERLRRTLFVLVVSYAVSSWMVDFGFRPTFFMFTGAIAAFYRHLYGMNQQGQQANSPFKPGAVSPEGMSDPRARWRGPIALPHHPTPLLTQNPKWRGEFAPATAETAPQLPAPAIILDPPSTGTAQSPPKGSWRPPWLASSEAQMAAKNSGQEEDKEEEAEATAKATTFAVPMDYWKRIGLIDLAITFAITKGAERFWAYLITRI